MFGISLASSVSAVVISSALGLAPVPSAKLVSTGGYVNTISAGMTGGSFGSHAVLWSGQTATDVHPDGFSFSAINGRSGGLSVGYAGTGSLAQSPMVWQGTTATALTVPFAYVTGRAVATDGLQIVGYANEGDPERGIGAAHALIWDIATGAVSELGNDGTINGVGGGVQVGYEMGSNGSNATLWRGTANSKVNLHVTGQDVSMACGTNGVIQVGYVGLDVRVRQEARPRDIRFYSAGYWSGTAESFTYLPSTYRHSFALAISGETIAGYGNTTDAIGTPQFSHAVAWVGSEHTFVDLHSYLPADMRTSRAVAVDETGRIAGYGETTDGVVRSYVWTVPNLFVKGDPIQIDVR